MEVLKVIIYRMLARHYGFTVEELDFILNYDLKYRLGRDTESDVELPALLTAKNTTRRSRNQKTN